MNKNQQKAVRYANLVSSVMTTMEDTQEELNPQFEALRKAIDADTAADFDPVAYADTIGTFTTGTQTYADLGAKLHGAQAPARLMGNHLMMVGAFDQFVAGCQAMVDSLHDSPTTLDVDAFNEAEAAQDEASAKLMRYLQKVSALA